MDNVTNPIAASTAGNLISQQAINSKRLRNKNSQIKTSDSTSDVIGDTLETSDREADGRQAYVIDAGADDSADIASNKKVARFTNHPDKAGTGNSLDVTG